MAAFRTEIPVGTRFGKLVVMGDPIKEWEEKNRRHRVYYPCRCDCGNTTLSRKDHLRNETASCGCVNKEKFQAYVDTLFKHGQGESRLYKTWAGMLSRCTNPDSASYRNYGGRGISVCDGWKDFSIFANWAQTTGYSDTLEIDRIDVNGNYCPENCRWVTIKTQARNRRNTIWVEAFGERKTLMDWSEDARCTVSANVLRGRVKLGWDAETAMLKA